VGTCSTRRGNGLPGQIVLLWSAGIAGPTRSTDEAGAYTFQVSPGSYSLSLGSSGNPALATPLIYNLDTATFTVSQDMVLDLTLPARRLALHVQDAAGAPVAGVKVATSTGWVSNLSLGPVTAAGITTMLPAAA